MNNQVQRRSVFEKGGIYEGRHDVFLVGKKRYEEYFAALWRFVADSRNDDIVIIGSPAVEGVCRLIIHKFEQLGFILDHWEESRDIVDGKVKIGYNYYMKRIPYLRNRR